MKLAAIWSTKDGNKNRLMLGIALALALIFMGFLKAALQPPPQPKTVEEVPSINTVVFEERVSTAMKVREELDAEKREKALAAIEEHEAAINRNSKSEDTPDRLMAVANLNQYQLGDYHSAIQSYRSLIDSYPRHAKVAQAYVEIATCYERLGDEAQARYVYGEMVQSLDPSLQHVQYAKLKLEGEK